MGTFSGIWGSNLLPQLIAKAIILFCCFPIHEYSHAWMASRLANPTGEREIRITRNPFAYLDLWGSIMFIIFGVGYAKPILVNPNSFRKPKKDFAIVSLAGPMSNLIIAVSFLFTKHVILMAVGEMTGCRTIMSFIMLCLSYTAYINFGLAVFNMIPIPPLDGYHVFLAFIPNRFHYRFVGLERYSLYAMLGLLAVFTLLRVSPVTVAAQNLYASVDRVYHTIFQ